MTVYKSFYAKEHGVAEEDAWFPKTINLSHVESWSHEDSDTTTVCMMSGDTFDIAEDPEDFTDMMLALFDGYGHLFTFNQN
jgi:hypothetical protein